MKVEESYVSDIKNDVLSSATEYCDTSSFDKELSKLNKGISNLNGQSNDEIGKALESVKIANYKSQIEDTKDKNKNKINDNEKEDNSSL